MAATMVCPCIRPGRFAAALLQSLPSPRPARTPGGFIPVCRGSVFLTALFVPASLPATHPLSRMRSRHSRPLSLLLLRLRIRCASLLGPLFFHRVCSGLPCHIAWKMVLAPAARLAHFRSLRTRWLVSERLGPRGSWIHGLASSIAAKLDSGERDPPLSDEALLPFLDDLRRFLQVTDDSIWESLLSVQIGQPFRLNLWRCLALICRDPRL